MCGPVPGLETQKGGLDGDGGRGGTHLAFMYQGVDVFEPEFSPSPTNLLPSPTVGRVLLTRKHRPESEGSRLKSHSTELTKWD